MITIIELQLHQCNNMSIPHHFMQGCCIRCCFTLAIAMLDINRRNGKMNCLEGDATSVIATSEVVSPLSQSSSQSSLPKVKSSQNIDDVKNKNTEIVYFKEITLHQKLLVVVLEFLQTLNHHLQILLVM